MGHQLSVKAKQRVSLADIILMGLFSYSFFFGFFFRLRNELDLGWQFWLTLLLAFLAQGLLIFSHPGTVYRNK